MVKPSSTTVAQAEHNPIGPLSVLYASPPPCGHTMPPCLFFFITIGGPAMWYGRTVLFAMPRRLPTAGLRRYRPVVQVLSKVNCLLEYLARCTVWQRGRAVLCHNATPEPQAAYTDPTV